MFRVVCTEQQTLYWKPCSAFTLRRQDPLQFDSLTLDSVRRWQGQSSAGRRVPRCPVCCVQLFTPHRPSIAVTHAVLINCPTCHRPANAGGKAKSKPADVWGVLAANRQLMDGIEGRGAWGAADNTAGGGSGCGGAGTIFANDGDRYGSGAGLEGDDAAAAGPSGRAAAEQVRAVRCWRYRACCSRSRGRQLVAMGRQTSISCSVRLAKRAGLPYDAFQPLGTLASPIVCCPAIPLSL